MKWIDTEKQLPPMNEFVLVKLAPQQWEYIGAKNLFHDVVIMVEDDIPEGNNKCWYKWKTFGPAMYFGQEVTHWMHIPELEE